MSKIVENIGIPGYTVVATSSDEIVKIDLDTVYINENVMLNLESLNFMNAMYSQHLGSFPRIPIETMLEAHICHLWNNIFHAIERGFSMPILFNENTNTDIFNKLIDHDLPEVVNSKLQRIKIDKADKEAMFISFCFSFPSVQTASFGETTASYNMYALWDKKRSCYVPTKTAAQVSQVTNILNKRLKLLSEEEFLSILKCHIDYLGIQSDEGGISAVWKGIDFHCPLKFQAMQWGKSKDTKVNVYNNFGGNLALCNVELGSKTISVGGTMLYNAQDRPAKPFGCAVISNEREWVKTQSKSHRLLVKEKELREDFIKFLRGEKHHIIYNNLLDVTNISNDFFLVQAQKEKVKGFRDREQASFLIHAPNDNDLDIIAQINDLSDSVCGVFGVVNGRLPNAHNYIDITHKAILVLQLSK